MERSTIVLAGVLALVALVVPVRAQQAGREIDLNLPQGRISYEQSEWLIVEGRKDQPGAGLTDGPGARLPKPGDDRFGKPEDLVTGLLEDPSEGAQDPKASPGGREPEGPPEPGGTDEFEGGEKAGPERFGGRN